MVLNMVNCKYRSLFAVTCFFIGFLLIVIFYRKNALVPNIISSRRSVDVTMQKTPAENRAYLRNKKCNVYTKYVPESFNQAKLKYSKGTAVIYVHHATDVISKSLLSTSSWEGDYIRGMETALNIDVALNLIDIGCNLGVYTIVAALRQRKVVAVDANIKNIKRLKKTLDVNNVSDRVHLLFNGISNRYMSFSITSDKDNLGNSALSPLKKNDAGKVNSIYMDDLLEVIHFKRAIMKIDIQAHEYQAFQHADQLFKEVDIPIVFMEWVWIKRNQTEAWFILNFFKRFNYKAFNSILSDEALNVNHFMKWPYDIVWKK